MQALDWDTTGPFQAYPVVMVRHPSDPDDGHSFVTVGYAGEVGAISGYSSAGVALSEKVWIRYAGEFSWEGAWQLCYLGRPRIHRLPLPNVLPIYMCVRVQF